MTLKKRIDRKWLRRLRSDRAWTIEEAAGACGIPRSTYGELERGVRVGTKNQWRRITAVFGIEVEQFQALEVEMEKVIESRALDTGLQKEKDRQQERGVHKSLRNFRPMLTVTREGHITGNYWKALEKANNRK